MTYVQRIRDLREDMDITQAEVAKILILRKDITVNMNWESENYR